jgi:hypothetical protein
MRSETLSHYLKEPGLREQLTGNLGGDAIVGIGRDPEDGRRNCIVLYVPQGFSRPLPRTVTVGGEEVRVVKRERGGVMRAYPAAEQP